MICFSDMYSIRPHISENLNLELPTTMYTVRPIIEKQQSTVNPTVFKNVEERQEKLLDRIEYLFKQLTFYQAEKSAVPILEPLVVHLSAKDPSKKILNFINEFKMKLSLRTYRHSSLVGKQFQDPLKQVSTDNRTLTIVWADGNELPYMFHSHMKITDEQAIVNLLSQQFN